MLDAKKGEVYAALFENAAGGLVEIIPQGAYDPDDFFSRLPGGRAISFIGAGSAVYRDRIPASVRESAAFPARTLFIAHEVGLLGFEGLEAGEGGSGGGRGASLFPAVPGGGKTLAPRRPARPSSI